VSNAKRGKDKIGIQVHRGVRKIPENIKNKIM
jgi:hypothetical protein